MGCDLVRAPTLDQGTGEPNSVCKDYAHPEVKHDVMEWGLWLGDELSLKGIRFDAIKHVRSCS
jgi:hypothetical protein